MLNRIVNLYLEYVELQALERKPMTMRDWIAKLDEFLEATGRELLDHAGKISHEPAANKAEREFERHRALHANEPSQVEKDFEDYQETARAKAVEARQEKEVSTAARKEL